METAQIRACRYVCSYCNMPRLVNVDPETHGKRRDLKNNGYAIYVDVHENHKNKKIGEHGVRLFIDANFDVRTNSLIHIEKPKKLAFSLPKPKINIEMVTYSSQLVICESLKLKSTIHNFSLKLENLFNFNKKVNSIKIESPFKSVKLDIKHYIPLSSQTTIDNLKTWCEVLLKWIEYTGKLQIEFIPTILKIIDANHKRSPHIDEEFIISVLIDEYAQIFLHDENPNLFSHILINSTVLSQINNSGNSNEFDKTDPATLKKVSEFLNANKIVKLSDLVSNTVAGKNSEAKMKQIDKLAGVVANLIREDLIAYKVSYLQ